LKEQILQEIAQLERFFNPEWALNALTTGGVVYAFESEGVATGGIILSQRGGTIGMMGDIPTDEHWAAVVSICDKEMLDRGAVKVVYQGPTPVLSDVFRSVGMLMYENWTGGELGDMFIGELLSPRLRESEPEISEPVGELIEITTKGKEDADERGQRGQRIRPDSSLDAAERLETIPDAERTDGVSASSESGRGRSVESAIEPDPAVHGRG